MKVLMSLIVVTFVLLPFNSYANQDLYSQCSMTSLESIKGGVISCPYCININEIDIYLCSYQVIGDDLITYPCDTVVSPAKFVCCNQSSGTTQQGAILEQLTNYWYYGTGYGVCAWRCSGYGVSDPLHLNNRCSGTDFLVVFVETYCSYNGNWYQRTAGQHCGDTTYNCTYYSGQ